LKEHSINKKVGNREKQREKGFLKMISDHLPPIVLKNSSFYSSLELALERADLWLSPGRYLTTSLILSTPPPILFSILFYILFLHGSGSSLYTAFLVFIPLSFFVTLYLFLSYPYYRASTRAKEISKNLEQSYIFISALANGDVPLNIIFRKLSQDGAFGEVRREAEKIVRLTEDGGMDIYAAMNIASRTSPSVEWRNFLQGAVNTAISGSRLKPYFLEKVENFHERMRLSIKGNGDAVSLFSEVYVAIGVAFPLFLAIILGVMSVISAPISRSTQFILLLFSFFIEPVITASFILIISSLNKEVGIE